MITIKQQVEVETLFFITLAALAGFFFVYKNNQNFKQQFNVTVPILASNVNQNTVASPIPLKPKVESASQVSSDGSKKLIMQTTTNTDNTKAYLFSVLDTNSSVEKIIYAQTVDNTSSFFLPFNAFSPDNKYFFIQQNKQDTKEYLAFQTSGAPFADGQLMFDISTIFTSKITTYTIDQVTGWASETLLVVNTTNTDGSKGPSFWVEVPSKAVIQLSTQF